MAKTAEKITTASTAEYFSKNLQQVGFSSPTKAVLTTLKEAVDNSLDACEEDGVLPEITVEVESLGPGHLKNTERIRVRVEDNGPGISQDDLAKVFGEYLASSKFGRGRCSRGQQGIGISAATTWAQLTNAQGAKVITKTSHMKKAISVQVEVDIKTNQGVLKNKDSIDWSKNSGTSVEFIIDGRVQVNGEGGLLTYLMGTILLNPHLTLIYTLPGLEKTKVERVSQTIAEIPPAVEPHPHTMKLGEFIAHSHLFGNSRLDTWLKTGFSRVTDLTLVDLEKVAKLPTGLLRKNLDKVTDEELKGIYSGLHNMELRAPSTQSVLSVGEEALSKSILRLGEVDFFAVLSRKPTICDFKPVQVEVAIARLKDRAQGDQENQVQILRFANRVPLQFDKAACAIVKAITTVNWRAYGINQPKDAIPTGPYIFAISVVSPFIKFKNASKETIDASDELVEELRRALIQAGQKLSRYIKREGKELELQERIKHIEQFAPILVEGLVRISKANAARKKKAAEGLKKILGKDAKEISSELEVAREKLAAQEVPSDGNS